MTEDDLSFLPVRVTRVGVGGKSHELVGDFD
jgi:hypothetical protein